MDCQHTNRTVVLTPETVHHAKEVCAYCGKFIQWLPKPETIARELEEVKKRAALWKKPITEWEKQFLMTIERAGGRMSPKQRVIFERMVREYGV